MAVWVSWVYDDMVYDASYDDPWFAGERAGQLIEQGVVSVTVTRGQEGEN